jgi:hypothetical protein
MKILKTASAPSRLRISLGVRFLGLLLFLGDREPKAKLAVLDLGLPV